MNRLIKFYDDLNFILNSVSNKSFRILMIILVITGMLLAFIARAGDSLTIDEPYSASLVRLSLPQMFTTLQNDNLSITYYVLLWGWVRIFGISELALRSLSMVFWGITIFVVGYLTRRILDWRAGLAASILLICSTSMGLEFAATARQYSLLCLVISVVLLFFLQLARLTSSLSPGSNVGVLSSVGVGSFFILIGINIFGLLTHAIYLFFLIAYTIAALIVSKRFFIQIAIANTVAVGLFLLLFWSALTVNLSLPTLSWMPKPDLQSLIAGYKNIFGGTKTVLLFTYLLGIFLLSVIHKKTGSRLLLILFVVVILGSIVPFLISYIRPIFDEQRTLIIILPAICILAAAMLMQTGSKMLHLILLLVLLSSSIIRSVQKYYEPDPVPTESSIETIAGKLNCGDFLIFGGLSYLESKYYLQRYNSIDCVQMSTFPADTQLHPGWIDTPGLLQNKEKILSEAKNLIPKISNVSGTKVFLFDDLNRDDQFLTEIIRNEFDQRFIFKSQLSLKGSFFDTIYVYEVE